MSVWQMGNATYGGVADGQGSTRMGAQGGWNQDYGYENRNAIQGGYGQQFQGYAGQVAPQQTAYNGYGNTGGYNQGGINSLLAAQMAENQATNAQNQGVFQTGVGMINNAESGYMNSPLVAAQNGLASQLMANPNVISSQLQNQIQGNAANTIAVNNNATGARDAGIMASRGEGDAQSMQANNNAINQQGIGQLTNVASNLDIQAALQNRQSQQAALQAGQSQSQQTFGNQMQGASTYLQNSLYQTPMNLSGYRAALGPMSGGGGEISNTQQPMMSGYGNQALMAAAQNGQEDNYLQGHPMGGVTTSNGSSVGTGYGINMGGMMPNGSQSGQQGAGFNWSGMTPYGNQGGPQSYQSTYGGAPSQTYQSNPIPGAWYAQGIQSLGSNGGNSGDGEYSDASMGIGPNAFGG